MNRIVTQTIHDEAMRILHLLLSPIQIMRDFFTLIRLEYSRRKLIKSLLKGVNFSSDRFAPLSLDRRAPGIPAKCFF